MTEGKIKFHEAMGYQAERNGDYAAAHTEWQMAEYYKREKHVDRAARPRTIQTESEGVVLRGYSEGPSSHKAKRDQKRGRRKDI